MATVEELQTALINADKAGDVEAAKILANEIIKLRQPVQTQIQPQEVNQNTWSMYFNNQLDPQQKMDIENKIKSGEIKLPENVQASIPTIPMSPERPQDTGIVLQKDYTPAEQIQAGLQTAGTLATGATTGAIGSIAGATKGIIGSMIQGTFGTQAGAKEAQRTSEEFAQTGTYQPDNKLAQEYTQNVAGALEPLNALTPAMQEIGASTRTIKNALPKNEVIKEIPKPITPTPEKMTIEGIVDVAKKASQGDKTAEQQLAKEVKLNPEAIAAADRLGVDLPSDILGDNELLKQTIGLVRSQIGDESAQFTDLIKNTAQKADDAINEMGKTNIASISDKILTDLKDGVKELDNISTSIYDKVTNQIPKSTEVIPINSLNKIESIVNDLGGVAQLTKHEKSLYNLLKQDKITYAALERERRQIGQALGKVPTGKYVNADQSMLKNVYSALKQDQLDNVESILGEAARNELHLADRTFQKKIALEKRIVDNFGKEGEGSISSLLTRAINQGSKGDITAINKVLNTIPKNLQKEALISGFADSISSSRGIDKGVFDFNKFTKVYEGLKSNTPVYNRFMVAIGGDKKQILDDLNTISKRLTDARSKVLTTGKANQAILKRIQEDALLQRVVKFTIEKGIQKATLGGLSPSTDMLFKTPKERLEALGKLVRSYEFYNLAKQSIEEVPTQKAIFKLINSKQFKNFNKAMGNTIKEPEAFILESINLQQGQNDGK